MKSSAIFVNVGRGTVVDESVLISKLRNKDIGGAVLDVTCEEPLPADHPLWECPNLIMTQHTGGGSREELKGKVSVFLENLALYLAGKPLKRVVKITSII
jgi:phosphoglycerate dehydrogenase-like enzyme